MLVIAQAINKAQSDDPKALQKALVGHPYQDWSGTVKFEEPQGLNWQNVSPPNLILQHAEVRQPFAETKLVWPSQIGGDGKIEGPYDCILLYTGIKTARFKFAVNGQLSRPPEKGSFISKYLPTRLRIEDWVILRFHTSPIIRLNLFGLLRVPQVYICDTNLVSNNK